MSFRQRTHQSALLKANDQTPARLMWYVNHAIVDQIMNEHIAQELSILYEGPRRLPAETKAIHKIIVDDGLSSNELGSQTLWCSHLGGAKHTTLFGAGKETKSVTASKGSCEVSTKFRHDSKPRSIQFR